MPKKKQDPNVITDVVVKQLPIPYKGEEREKLWNIIMVNQDEIDKCMEKIKTIKETMKTFQTIFDSTFKDLRHGYIGDVDCVVTKDYNKRMIFITRKDTGKNWSIKMTEEEHAQTSLPSVSKGKKEKKATPKKSKEKHEVEEVK